MEDNLTAEDCTELQSLLFDKLVMIDIRFDSIEEISEEIAEENLYDSTDSSNSSLTDSHDQSSTYQQAPTLCAAEIKMKISQKWNENHKLRLNKILEMRSRLKHDSSVRPFDGQKTTIFKTLDISNNVIFEYHKINEIDLIRKVLLFLQGLLFGSSARSYAVSRF